MNEYEQALTMILKLEDTVAELTDALEKIATGDYISVYVAKEAIRNAKEKQLAEYEQPLCQSERKL